MYEILKNLYVIDELNRVNIMHGMEKSDELQINRSDELSVVCHV